MGGWGGGEKAGVILWVGHRSQFFLIRKANPVFKASGVISRVSGTVRCVITDY